MRKKINSNDILRLVYESYKHILKESENAQQNSGELVGFQPSYSRGQYYFNVTFTDKKSIKNFRYFDKELVSKIINSTKARNIKLTDEDLEYLQQKYKVATDNKAVNDDTKVIYIKVALDDPITLLTDDGHLNKESKDAKAIWNVMKELENRGVNFDKNFLKDAVLTTYYYAANKPTDESIEQFDYESKKLFFKICQTLGEEETKNLLRTIQVTDDAYLIDHQFAFGNKLRIISQAMMYDQRGDNQVNTISYLATPRQWRKMGRRVVDFSHPYHTVTFNGDRGSQGKEIEYAKKKGKATLVENNSKKLNFQAGRAVNTAVNAEMYGKNSFSYNDSVYDVQATETVNGIQDKFTEEPGMKNNLTGELNDVALQKLSSLNNSSNAEREERTNKLNDMFGTTNYKDVDLIYQATCAASKSSPILDKNADIKAKIKETGNVIDKMLIKDLSGFKDGEGHIARPENYLPLVPIGRIIIQAIIGLPMDDAPAIQWVQEHESITNALSKSVNEISNKILRNKRAIANTNKQDITEMLNIYGPMLVFEETFNKFLKLLMENAEI